MLDNELEHREIFAFKRHYVTGAIDSEIVCLLFMAMSDKKTVTLKTINRNKERILDKYVVPLRIMDSVQSGRQYLMAYFPRYKRIISVDMNEFQRTLQRILQCCI